MKRYNVEELRERAGILADLDRDAESIPLLLKALESEPENALLLGQIAMAFFSVGDSDNALLYAQQAVRADPEEAKSYYVLSLLLLQRQRYRLALRAAEEAVRLDPHSLQALYMLAQCLLYRKRVAEAERVAHQIIEIAPEWISAHELMAEVRATQRRWKEVEACARHALTLAPNSAEALELVGRALRYQGRALEAVEPNFRAVQQAPKNEFMKQSLDASVDICLLPKWLARYGSILFIMLTLLAGLNSCFVLPILRMNSIQTLIASIMSVLLWGAYLGFQPQDYLRKYLPKRLKALPPEVKAYVYSREEILGCIFSWNHIRNALFAYVIGLIAIAFVYPHLPEHWFYGDPPDFVIYWSFLYSIPTVYMGWRLYVIVTQSAKRQEEVNKQKQEEEVRLAEEAVAYAPESPGTVTLLAEAQQAAGQVDQAVETSRILQQIAPDQVASYLMAARLEEERKNWQQVEELSRKALELNPDSIEAHVLIGKAINKTQLPEEAIRYLARVLVRHPQAQAVQEELSNPAGRMQMPSLQMVVAVTAIFMLMLTLTGVFSGKAFGYALLLGAIINVAVYLFCPEAFLKMRPGYHTLTVKERELVVASWKKERIYYILASLMFLLVGLIFCGIIMALIFSLLGIKYK